MARETKMTRPTLHQCRPSRSATPRASSTPAVTLATRWRLPVIVVDQGELGDQEGGQRREHGRLGPGQAQGQLPGDHGRQGGLGRPQAQRGALVPPPDQPTEVDPPGQPARRPPEPAPQRPGLPGAHRDLPPERRVDGGGVGQLVGLQVVAVLELAPLHGRGVEAEPDHRGRAGCAGEPGSAPPAGPAGGRRRP